MGRDYRQYAQEDANQVQQNNTANALKGLQFYAEQADQAASQKSSQDAALKQLLQGKQADLSNTTAENQQKYDLGQQGLAANADRAQQLVDANRNTNGGRASAAVDANGNVSIQQTAPDIVAQQMKLAQQQAVPLHQAQQQYQAGAKDIAEKTQALQQGLGALQTNDNTSLGTLRAALYKSQGLGRYNDAEAARTAPDSVKNQLSQVAGSLGFDTSSEGSLNDVQRANATKYFQNQLNNLQQQHEGLKSQVAQNYQLSGLANPQIAGSLGSTLGSSTDQTLSKLQDSYQQLQKAVPNSAPPTGATATPDAGSWGDKLAAYFGRAKAPAQLPPQQKAVTQQAASPQAGTAPAAPAFNPDTY